ncbi:MAG: hypothetical protein UR89_C0015G0001 [Candidatus Roizmanbacteria bacterium GW2011_GWA2_35_8]|uniref:Uncharacterized protein n=1 Tax=Candidatus Roizmanbacteria bacterium GW2011_GWA2_35_8 TaxID=1618479 RepID=A0A0G0D090_9BACT|nr:MAG: hypothetical protein UR89_C0015G0001 [Candidatus Roizmanbacteria bacterium GW2011_GWA2_35_8]
MKLNSGTEIKSVEFTDVNTNKKILLFERIGSRCHFRDTIRYENYFVRLRLDWGDIDKYGEPVLDADIWTEVNEKKVFKKKGVWHHTRKEIDTKTDQWKYIFKFKSLELHITTKKTIAKFLTAKAKITNSLAINYRKKQGSFKK